jgi:hypothetical protein
MADQILTDAERKALQAILQISDYGEGRAISDSDVYDADFLEIAPLNAYWSQYAPNAGYYLSEDFGASSQIAQWLSGLDENGRVVRERFTPRQVIDEIKKNETLFPKDSNGSQQSWFDDVQSLNREISTVLEQRAADVSAYEEYWKKSDLPAPLVENEDGEYVPRTYDVNALLRIPQYAEYETNVRKFIRSKNDGKYTSYEEDVLKQLREGAQQKLIDSGITPFGDAVLTKKASLLGVALPKAASVKSDKPAGTTINKALGIDEAPRPAVPLATAKAAGAKIKTTFTPAELAKIPTPEQILAKFRQEQGLK